MQSIAPVTTNQLLASGQEPLMKFEIYDGADWINLCDLAGKSYVENISVSLGGAALTPKPIGGTWNASLFNEDSIFHPNHPTSAYKTYITTGRRIRASIGAKYGGTDYYWQRIIGYIDEPSFGAGGQRISISGADDMKFLEDTEFGDLDNYWGTSATFSSVSSDGLSGSELYNEADAMDIDSEANNVTNWTPDEVTFTSEADAGGGSTYVGKAVTTDEEPYIPTIVNSNIFIPEANQEYVFNFKYKMVSGSGAAMRVIIKQFITYWREIGQKEELCSTDYVEESVRFTTQGTEAVQIWLEFYGGPIGSEFRVDQFSIFKFIPYWERYYELPAASKGPYRVLLDGVDVWQGEVDEGWYYEEATRRVVFDINKTVAVGVDNLVIHYFTAEAPENVVADILVKVNLYADRATALAAMDYTATGITIDKNWFEVGSTRLNAIKMICERCDYRFHFEYDGTPVFKPKPAPGSTAFTFTDQKHIASARNYQNRDEIKNRIVIEGMKLAEPVNKEGTLLPKLRGEAHDDTSIDAYGERSLTIKNHLFQDQTKIDNMCASLLAEYKDPKLYADVEVPFNPVPLELGDKMSWKERLSPILEITQAGIIRDIKIDAYNTIYRCEIT